MKQVSAEATYQDLERGKDAVRRVIASQLGQQSSQRITQLNFYTSNFF